MGDIGEKKLSAKIPSSAKSNTNLSTVKHTKFQVEATSPPQRNISPFQIEHSKSPNIPSNLVLNTSLMVKAVSNSIKEHSKSIEL